MYLVRREEVPSEKARDQLGGGSADEQAPAAADHRSQEREGEERKSGGREKEGRPRAGSNLHQSC
jgi:hypothetical protein